MEISSDKKVWIPTRLITEDYSSPKEWIGKVNKKDGEFSIQRYQKGLLGKRASFVKIIGIKKELTNQIEISFKPTLLFVLNYFFVPCFLYFFLIELNLGNSVPFLIGILVLFNSLHLFYEFKKSKSQMMEFMDSLK